MAPVGECKCTLCKSLDPVEENLFGKKSFCLGNYDLYPLKQEPEVGCSCENCVDLAQYRKDPSLEKFSSQQFCLDKCKCRLCVRTVKKGQLAGITLYHIIPTSHACALNAGDRGLNGNRQNLRGRGTTS